MASFIGISPEGLFQEDDKRSREGVADCDHFDERWYEHLPENERVFETDEPIRLRGAILTDVLNEPAYVAINLKTDEQGDL